MRSESPYGTWHSRISAPDLARSAIALNYVRVADGTPYWIESRPAQGGRHVVVKPAAGGGVTELTPMGFNARTRVHEYGGSPFIVLGNKIYFSNFPDQRIYAQTLTGNAAPTALTPEGYRYADYDADPSGTRLYCVREDHTASGEPRNAIVAIETGLAVDSGPTSDATASSGSAASRPDPAAGTVLFEDSDFVAYPRVSPDGRHLAWIAWNHPDMPWDATSLYVADITAEGLSHITRVAGGPEESVTEPRWTADGSLYFISDRSNWWNLYRLVNGQVETVHEAPVELATPLWTLGQSNYALLDHARAVVRFSENAIDSLGLLDLMSGTLTPLELPFISLSNVQLLSANPPQAIAIAATAVEEAAVVTIDLTSGAHEVLRAPGELRLSAQYVSVGEAIEFPTAGGETAHAFYYPPQNPDHTAPADEKPPVIVKVHGGPTSHSKAELNMATQYWTSRGFALVDVNYGGSSGYGRQYRQRLNGNWGVVDVEDVVNVVKYLARQGWVDSRRAAIRGGSAGGFTVLAALAFHDVFQAGANYYGVSDLEALAHDTHKFESRYLDRLVAPLPEGKSLYEERAPIRHLEQFKAPLITFQGAEDKVVPPSQSRAIVAALREKGVRVEYIEFEGEQHGFRKAQSIVRSLEAELAFYGEVFGFRPA
jgi:dipeptidyl aminopeptidase/acylaminoacyl peptidase